MVGNDLLGLLFLSIFFRASIPTVFIRFRVQTSPGPFVLTEKLLRPSKLAFFVPVPVCIHCLSGFALARDSCQDSIGI